MADNQKETREFQTEVQQLLHLMIHSLYSNKEIFLRELISNASDASDKLRFEAQSDDSLYENNPEIDVRITFDQNEGTMTISDGGIGMSRDEVVENIGTIARSGTKDFLKSLSGDEAKDAHLIGQFGVGFYSAFIVADKVTLTTRRAGQPADTAVRWESAGDGKYELETVNKEGRGTEVVLHLKEDEKEFLEHYRLSSVIRKFSDHISWPIKMLKQAPPPMPSEEGEEAETVVEAETAPEWETVNSASALWTRRAADIKDEEYNEFYKHVGHDYEEPLRRLHTHLEGTLEYSMLLFLPKRAPFDLWDRDRKHGVKLYVRRVFIMEGAEELLPRYLRFIRGVIDSSDLPLNVSREILQQNRVVRAIRKGLINKSLTMLENLANEEDGADYQGFWDTFGLVLKEGVVEDHDNKERVAKLLRFASTHNSGEDKPEVQNVSLEEYVSRMKEGQDKIYYVVAENFAAASHSPHQEIFRKKGIEVLLLTDRVDEWLVGHLNEFDGKTLQAVSKGELDLGEEASEEEKEEQKKVRDSFEDLVKKVKESLGDQLVKDVRITNRLTDSPSCLVGDDQDMSAAMERLLREAGQAVPASTRTLELNPEHALVKRLNEEKDDGRFNDLSRILFDQAQLSEGAQLEDPSQFVHRLNKLLLDLAV